MDRAHGPGGWPGRLLRLLPMLLGMAALSWLSHQPALAFQPSGAPFWDALIGLFGFPQADKVVHLGLYAVLALLGRVRFGRGSPANIVLCLAFGGLDEWHQHFVPGRCMDLLDWLADATGALLGALPPLRRRRAQE